ncbi:helix-turn-helix domain-containing protein [Polynucleobacter sp. Adler-ghost]|uniref:helix-turn-helix domain-containing protein n=1 Tax=Polynucleobacter sp. Adler-ghost TaxID=2770234 RepID=UPI001BFD07C9|nr:helix-turn-helix domain-containing protein [Polynucleobacter sp. Adler-ghost]QWE29899.1 MerR family transcriptional regulator [Polynucleobacter sp. Adler-ghost]
MGFLINQYHGFSGNAVDMASVATQCAQYLQMPGDLDKINERLVRYYVTEGLVDRPKRIGRDAEYGYLHLLQFLAGRFLVDAGFPMQKVAPYLSSLESAQLEALVMNKTKPNMAELLVASFQNPSPKSMRSASEDQSSSVRKIKIKDPSASEIPWVMANSQKSVIQDALSADLNAFASRIQASIPEPVNIDSLERLDRLSDQVNKQINDLSETIRHSLSDLVDRAQLIAERERMVYEERFERMRLVMLDERAQWFDTIDRERAERQNQFLEMQEKLNRLMAMMAEQGKGKAHD